MGKKFLQFLVLTFVNCIVFLVLFVAAEISCRLFRDGFTKTVSDIAHFFHQVPYSNLGTSNWVIFDEELGYRLNPGKAGINNFSIRHGEIAVPKPEGTYRIMYLGDSIPWDRGGFVDRTRDFLQGEGQFEVINAGIPGYTSYQEVLFYEKYLQPTSPDLVIWTYCLNDNHKFLHRFDEKAQMLWTEEAERTLRIHTVWDDIVSRSYLLARLNLGISALIKHNENSKCAFPWENRIDFNTAWKDDSWIDYERYLLRLKTILHKQNAKLAIIIFPYEPQLLYRNDTDNYNYAVKPQRKLRDLCNKYEIVCLDLYQSFADEYSREIRLYRDGIHLSSGGHNLATQQILSFLIQNDLLTHE
jgi:lysophospholipase L1-like esterase